MRQLTTIRCGGGQQSGCWRGLEWGRKGSERLGTVAAEDERGDMARRRVGMLVRL